MTTPAIFPSEGDRRSRFDAALTVRLKPYLRAVRASGRSILALLLRESRTRYGRRSGGYVWALVSPFILLVVLIASFSVLGRPPGAGDSLTIFFLTAILPIFLFRDSISRGGRAIFANRVLMQYPQVNAFEVVTARTVLEFLTYLIVLAIFVFGMFAFLGLPFGEWVDRPLQLLAAGGSLFVLCYGACFLSSQIGRSFEPWNEVTGPIGRLLLLTSGLFFTLGSLPPEFLAVVKWNPVAHIIEWIRDAAIRDFTSDLYDPFFPLAVGVVFLAIGMFIDWLYRISGYDLQP